MKEYFGIDLKRYGKPELSSIYAAVCYQLTLCRFYIVWNFIFMFSGVIFVYINSGWLTTYEILGYLGLFWGVSGMPFFIIKDLVKHKFTGKLPSSEIDAPSPLAVFLKLLAGFALGSWATHVMLIAIFAKSFELMHYARNLREA